MDAVRARGERDVHAVVDDDAGPVVHELAHAAGQRHQLTGGGALVAHLDAAHPASHQVGQEGEVVVPEARRNRRGSAAERVLGSRLAVEVEMADIRSVPSPA